MPPNTSNIKANKAKELPEKILAFAKTRGPGIKLPTIQEMCRQFCVSRTTLEKGLAAIEKAFCIANKAVASMYQSA